MKFVIATAALFALACSTTAAPPNILVFYVDDMAWGQPGCYGGKLAPTPHIDALAKGGVLFTDGYVSACVCAPSRVGLLTGRYQARTGHDANTGRAGRELLLSETTLAQRLQAAGYRTGIVGKWHLGDTTEEFLPVSRGFDVSFGSIDNLGGDEGKAGFYRGLERLPTIPGAPITSPIYAREACDFLRTSVGKPFFLYVAFNAIHSPHVASPAWLEKFRALPNREAAYAAIIAEVDDAVGTVMEQLQALDRHAETLVFLISDNGGAAGHPEFNGLRGAKWLLWEGGIRVPWIASWSGRIPGGRTVREPVIQLDVFPTALAAAGIAVDPQWELDGVNLLPLLEGREKTLNRSALYWRFGEQFAVRQGDWKLVKAAKDMTPVLVNLANDPGEQHDLSSAQPETARQLQALYNRWNATMQPPRWIDSRWDGEEARQNRRQNKKAR